MGLCPERASRVHSQINSDVRDKSGIIPGLAMGTSRGIERLLIGRGSLWKEQIWAQIGHKVLDRCNLRCLLDTQAEMLGRQLTIQVGLRREGWAGKGNMEPSVYNWYLRP